VDPARAGDVLWSAEVEGTIDGCRYSPVSNKLVLLVTCQKRFKLSLNKLEQRVWIWDLNTGQSSKLDYIGCYPDMTLNNQGTRLLLAMPEQLLLWDVESAVQLHSLGIRSYMSSNACFSGDDARIASDEGGVITVVESSSGRTLSSFNSLPLQQTLGAIVVLLSHEGELCGHTRGMYSLFGKLAQDLKSCLSRDLCKMSTLETRIKF
jgi:WD40 repeat protein